LTPTGKENREDNIIHQVTTSWSYEVISRFVEESTNMSLTTGSFHKI